MPQAVGRVQGELRSCPRTGTPAKLPRRLAGTGLAALVRPRQAMYSPPRAAGATFRQPGLRPAGGRFSGQ